MPRGFAFFCEIFLAALTRSILVDAAKIRVLFVGNSFTFVQDLPRQLQNVAKSLGDDVEFNSSTVGGCTLYRQQAALDNVTAQLLQQKWDFIVLQDYSLLPSVKRAREVYLNPSVKDFSARKGTAKIVMYLTWGYHDGLGNMSCPTSDAPKCFPLGTLADLTHPSCKNSTQYQESVHTFECMGYSLARGYFAAMQAGADLVAPCGLAWQVVRGSKTIPADCKKTIDDEYDAPMALNLPFRVEGGALPDHLLNIMNLNGKIDKHPNLHGSYLNALVFYATLFLKSPVGAAKPVFSPVTWGFPPLPLSRDELKALQTAAGATVVLCGEVCGLPNVTHSPTMTTTSTTTAIYETVII